MSKSGDLFKSPAKRDRSNISNSNALNSTNSKLFKLNKKTKTNRGRRSKQSKQNDLWNTWVDLAKTNKKRGGKQKVSSRLVSFHDNDDDDEHLMNEAIEEFRSLSRSPSSQNSPSSPRSPHSPHSPSSSNGFHFSLDTRSLDSDDDIVVVDIDSDTSSVGSPSRTVHSPSTRTEQILRNQSQLLGVIERQLALTTEIVHLIRETQNSLQRMLSPANSSVDRESLEGDDD